MSDDGLWDALEDQRGDLEGSVAIYDGGRQSEARRLAVTTRVLVHDTGSSHSLLEQLGVKSTLSFASMSERHVPLPPDTFSPGSDFYESHFELGGGKAEASYHPQLGEPKAWLDFDVWWHAPALTLQSVWSRKDLVLALANRDGGAHIDLDRLGDEYKAIRHRNQLNERNQITPGFSLQMISVIGDDGSESAPQQINDPVLTIMRTIAHEMLLTLADVQRLTVRFPPID